MVLSVALLLTALPLPATPALDAPPAAMPAAITPAATTAMPRPFLTDCPAPTGRSATLLLPPDAAVMPAGGPLEPGDEIAVVTPGGACAGLGTWSADGVAIAVWADDPFTPAPDGLTPGTPLAVAVFDASTGTIYDPVDVSVTFAEGYGGDGGFQVSDLYVVAPRTASTGAEEPTAELALAQSFPNPARGLTTLPFELPAESRVTLDVFDALGRRVARAAEGVFVAGRHSVAFDAGALASGVYVYRLQAGEEFLQRRLVVSR